ncbi:FAD-dependent oxidoreductase [Actinoplanes sp. NBRC 103695]|uniref:FAD-dependent oxidoreductase n=1 Tax=Actinoplanes sp. NBRC 103695 TaxID=3032202 RepID=UPI0024A00DF5|nr:FAD-dependent oxidoreductase [Actinoplanes sp. NBRC 103695]GLY98908.1 flavoprotein oxidoreductase [Actinoplanes sp. NBRC 103695]
MTTKLVVIGGDAAGMSAASQAGKLLKDGLDTVVFERGNFTSYSACGIPYWIGGAVADRDALIARTPAQHRENGIDVRLRHEVVGIDLDRREIVAHDLEAGGEVRESFDQLVYATGAVPVTPPWARDGGAGVFGVQTLDDGAAIQDFLSSFPGGRPRRAVVIGGGYIGVEMAEAMVQRGLEVTLLEKAAQPMRATVDPDMGALVHAAIEKQGIDVRTGAHVDGLEMRDGRVHGVITPDGTLPADIVVLGLGVRPNTALAERAGLPLGPTGGLRTDLRMRVLGADGPLDGIWAAGDCVQTVHRVSRRPVHVPLGTHANKQGRVAGINIGGGYATFPGVIGTAVTKVCELEVARTGLSSAEAETVGYAFVTAAVESTSRAGYYPGAAPMTIKLIAEKRTGLLLGAQIVGREEAAKRIDALAIAVWNRMTVEEMTALDLGYAPPFAPVWDPVLIAARKATDAVHAAF